uniref:Uncharacterized protein n=1 Tax=Arundo donax TaxID=35708 RepID=A0A0A9AFT5_ARUDO
MTSRRWAKILQRNVVAYLLPLWSWGGTCQGILILLSGGG